ncbi:MAG: HEAT repeat domain-containing protein [Deltaproteobacteria bacterium]|nr:HEAT repeat domain-containing protein [Deltaproteobacteria bacterium]
MKNLCRVAIAAAALVTAACQEDKTDELRTKLKSPEVAARVAAASELGKQRTASRPAIPELLAALKDEAWQVRVAASVALVRIGDKESPPRAALPLAVLARDSNAFVRRYAIWALGMMGAGHAALVTAVRDPEPLVREFAAEALKGVAAKADAKTLADARTALEALSHDEARLASGKFTSAVVVKDALAAVEKAATKAAAKEAR